MYVEHTKRKTKNNSLCNNPNGVRGLSYVDEQCIDRKVECILNHKKKTQFENKAVHFTE